MHLVEGLSCWRTCTLSSAVARKKLNCKFHTFNMLCIRRFSSAIAREKLQEAGYNSRDMKGMVDVMASIGILQVMQRPLQRSVACLHPLSLPL